MTGHFGICQGLVAHLFNKKVIFGVVFFTILGVGGVWNHRILVALEMSWGLDQKISLWDARSDDFEARLYSKQKNKN